MSKRIIQKLRQIGKSNNWDIIEEISSLDGRPVFRLRNSKIQKGAKTGYPHLYSVSEKGEVFELSSEQIHEVIVLYNGLCKRIQ